ncbi:unnamed protein product [Strongylus vulgaris]|uniref:Uncharacterized protein n=1 Tax=Strongylus vulgaris TaxID=40348 RepID=A0A3P7I2V7_STRVU|nr:unnamed protein product [Strongylus vulgaris]
MNCLPNKIIVLSIEEFRLLSAERCGSTLLEYTDHEMVLQR